MTVLINNKAFELVEKASLADALVAANIGNDGIATAVNGEVIPGAHRQSHKLAQGDKVVIIRAFCGG